MTLPNHGALFGQVLRDRLGMTQGDTVHLLISGGTAALSVQVAGFVDEPLGAPVYLSIEELRRSAIEVSIDPGTLVTAAALRFATGADPVQVRTQVSAQTGVQAYVDTKALKDSLDSLLGFFYVIVGLMLAFSTVLAFALIFNTASVALAERRTEVATLLASGMGYWTVGLLVVGENLLVTALGIAPGLGIAWLAGRAFLATFNTDLFRFVWHPGLGTLVLSTLALQAVAVAAQAPGMLAIRRLDIASIIRERAT